MRRPARRRLDGPAAVAGLAQGAEVRAGRREDLFARHVGWKGRRVQHAGVQHQHVHAGLAQQVADVAELGAFGVERAD